MYHINTVFFIYWTEIGCLYTTKPWIKNESKERRNRPMSHVVLWEPWLSLVWLAVILRWRLSQRSDQTHLNIWRRRTTMMLVAAAVRKRRQQRTVNRPRDEILVFVVSDAIKVSFKRSYWSTHTLCTWAATVLAILRMCADSPKTSSLDSAISIPKSHALMTKRELLESL